MIESQPSVAGGVIQPWPHPTPPQDPYFVGSLAEATARLNSVLATGQYATPPQLHPLDDGRVLLVTQIHPTHPIPPHPTPSQGGTGVGGRLGKWAPVIVASGIALGVAVTAVLLFLLVVGLTALVQWGMANALTIGAIVVLTVVTGLVFLVMLARARGGYPVRRY